MWCNSPDLSCSSSDVHQLLPHRQNNLLPQRAWKWDRTRKAFSGDESQYKCLRDVFDDGFDLFSVELHMLVMNGLLK